MKVLFLSLIILFHFQVEAATVEEFSVEVGYHDSEILMLKKIRAQKLEEHFLVKVLSPKKARFQKISKKEFDKRKQSFLKLQKLLEQNRSLASACPRYAKLAVKSKPAETYCLSFLDQKQNKALSTWWKTGN